MFNKINNIKTKSSPYNSNNLKVKYCPAFDKTTYRQKVEKLNVDKENVVKINKLLF